MHLGLSLGLTAIGGGTTTYSVTSNIGTLSIALTDNEDGTHTAAVTGTPAYYVGNYTVQTADLASGIPIPLVPADFTGADSAKTVNNAALWIYPNNDVAIITQHWLVDDVEEQTGGGPFDMTAHVGAKIDFQSKATNTASPSGETSVVNLQASGYLPAVQTIVNAAGEGLILDPATGAWQDTAGTTAAGDTDPVGRIDDQSSHGNNALQATAADKPTLTVSGAYTYIQGDGSTDHLESVFVSTAAGMYIAVALERAGFGAQGIPAAVGDAGVNDSGQDYMQMALNSNTATAQRRYDKADFSWATGALLKIVEVWHDGTTMGVSLNGATDVTKADTSTAFNTTILRLLESTDASNSSTVKVYGVVAMNAVPSAGDRTSIRTYLDSLSGALP